MISELPNSLLLFKFLKISSVIIFRFEHSKRAFRDKLLLICLLLLLNRIRKCLYLHESIHRFR